MIILPISQSLCHTKSLSDWKWKCNGKYAVIMTPYGVVPLFAQHQNILNKQTHTAMPSKRPPWGWRGDGRTSGAEAGSAFFFSRNDGITESGKKLWGGGGGWLVSRNHSGWMAGSRRNYCGTSGPQDLFRGLLYQGISTVFTGFCQLYW